MWNIFLTDFKFHLEAKSWLDITYIGINENPMEETLAAINVVRNHDKCWKITYAGNWHKELDGLLDDYSFLYGEEPTIAEQKARAATGRTSTVYVCCNPPIPNNFVFSPPLSLLIPTFAFPKAPAKVILHLRRRWNAPLPCISTSIASVNSLCPSIIHAGLLD